MQALNTTSAESFRQAAGFFQSAIDKDPSFAMAWLGLARAHDSMSSEVAPEFPTNRWELKPGTPWTWTPNLRRRMRP